MYPVEVCFTKGKHDENSHTRNSRPHISPFQQVCHPHVQFSRWVSLFRRPCRESPPLPTFWRATMTKGKLFLLVDFFAFSKSCWLQECNLSGQKFSGYLVVKTVQKKKKKKRRVTCRNSNRFLQNCRKCGAVHIVSPYSPSQKYA